ncbi:thiol peroxidase [Clostridium botulinum]|uniref:Thiol peroxidase n=4 Tax=Clostridium botulinum TaxID=1491 RepID=A5HZ46_CLOBH|nr:thiol peroxidase [Clostridium botulinum]AJD26902.1 putative thiol peroxidase [Clostridium botulinum CDC_297]EKN42684.1 lipid hydroperoxide peroxidase [Clostridium botulinum CFSAN001627]EPS47672.1 lipid hydroperoxide peroxidase [Clostridium botulinum CFSAN002367]EPS48533.1 lipid hydroperoxide peroxidase [Clostridium botulinum A1 str. CFSAN002368]ABS35012.1 putative thiol peroxidase [Clostridium botulinum A str. ATCC 19397]
MEIKFMGNPMTLEGNELKVGDMAPDFTAIDNNMKPVSLKDTKGVRILSVVPSLDTEVCDLETRTFNSKAAEIPNVTIYTISMDLPFAQARWCGAHGVDKVITLSDFKDRLVGKNYGTYIKELGLLTRAVFVIDSNNKITFVEYVPEVTNQPNFDKVLEAAKAAK